jgi:hypothetical protein
MTVDDLLSMYNAAKEAAMRPHLPLIVCATVFAIAGCDMLFPPYWVSGLTLPAGSTVVSKSETAMSTSTMPNGIPLTMPGVGAVDKSLTVSFDCAGGWSAVSSHIDSCMTRQGYADAMAGLQGMAGGAGGSQYAQAASMLSSMRSYSKGGSKYTVMLMDMGATMAAASSYSKQSLPTNIPGQGQFMLMVMKGK